MALRRRLRRNRSLELERKELLEGRIGTVRKGNLREILEKAAEEIAQNTGSDPEKELIALNHGILGIGSITIGIEPFEKKIPASEVADDIEVHTANINHVHILKIKKEGKEKTIIVIPKKLIKKTGRRIEINKIIVRTQHLTGQILSHPVPYLAAAVGLKLHGDNIPAMIALYLAAAALARGKKARETILKDVENQLRTIEKIKQAFDNSEAVRLALALNLASRSSKSREEWDKLSQLIQSRLKERYPAWY